MSFRHSLRRVSMIVSSLILLATSSRQALAVTIDAPPSAIAYPGDKVQFITVIHSSATAPATEAVTLTATLPAGIDGITLSGFTCQTTGAAVVCTASLSSAPRIYPVVSISSSAPYGARIDVPIHVSSTTDTATTTGTTSR